MDTVKTKPIPEKYLHELRAEEDTKRKELGNLLSLSLTAINLEEKLQRCKESQKKIKDKLQTMENRTKTIIDRAFKKLGLQKEDDYNWEYKGTTFRGVLKNQKGGKR